jgi:hypothetical protein
MRREKIDEALVAGLRREIDLVNKTGEGLFRRKEPGGGFAAARKADDAQFRSPVDQPEAEALHGCAVTGQFETGGLENAKTGRHLARLLGAQDRPSCLRRAPCEFEVKRYRGGDFARPVNEEIQQSRVSAGAGELPKVLAAASGSMPPRDMARDMELHAPREFRWLQAENVGRIWNFDEGR